MRHLNVNTSTKFATLRRSAIHALLSAGLALALAFGLGAPAAAQDSGEESPSLRMALASVLERAPEGPVSPPDTARGEDPEDPELELLLERIAALEAQVRAAKDAAES